LSASPYQLKDVLFGDNNIIIIDFCQIPRYNQTRKKALILTFTGGLYMNESYVKSLSVSLPDELLRLKYAGYFDEFREAAKHHMCREDLPDSVKQRILLEIHNAEIIKQEYTISEKEIIGEIASYLPGFTEDDFKKLAGDLDYVFINGQKKYANFSVSSLFITSKLLREWPGSTYPESEEDDVDYSRKLMRKNGKACVSIDIEFICNIAEEYAKDNNLLVHLPYPNPNGIGMKSVEFISSSPSGDIATEEAPQRTIAFRADGNDQSEFSCRCRVQMENTYMTYDDLLKAADDVTEDEEKELMKAIRPGDLEEKAPHYVFSPFIRDLSEKIVGDEKNKTRIAKKIYDYITHQYEYAYVREYAAIDNLPEYFALRGRGDCGLQASLFITLCRYNGIPARWQSGIVTDGERGGAHDWAAAYFKGVGFRPVDPSFGLGGRRRNKPDDNAFYFGNMDPYRITFNTDIQEAFIPAKEEYRMDPYDNQYGEAETSTGMLTKNEAVFTRIIHDRSIK
jgi:transglutaminase-like putative cysteine protease